MVDLLGSFCLLFDHRELRVLFNQLDPDVLRTEDFVLPVVIPSKFPWCRVSLSAVVETSHFAIHQGCLNDKESDLSARDERSSSVSPNEPMANLIM